MSEDSDSEIDDVNVFVVERILEKKYVNGAFYYKIRWLGYGEADDTWEPRENIIDTNLIKKFEDSIKDMENANGGVATPKGVSAITTSSRSQPSSSSPSTNYSTSKSNSKIVTRTRKRTRESSGDEEETPSKRKKSPPKRTPSKQTKKPTPARRRIYKKQKPGSDEEYSENAEYIDSESTASSEEELVVPVKRTPRMSTTGTKPISTPKKTTTNRSSITPVEVTKPPKPSKTSKRTPDKPVVTPVRLGTRTVPKQIEVKQARSIREDRTQFGFKAAEIKEVELLDMNTSVDLAARSIFFPPNDESKPDFFSVSIPKKSKTSVTKIVTSPASEAPQFMRRPRLNKPNFEEAPLSGRDAHKRREAGEVVTPKRARNVRFNDSVEMKEVADEWGGTADINFFDTSEGSAADFFAPLTSSSTRNNEPLATDTATIESTLQNFNNFSAQEAEESNRLLQFGEWSSSSENILESDQNQGEISEKEDFYELFHKSVTNPKSVIPVVSAKSADQHLNTPTTVASSIPVITPEPTHTMKNSSTDQSNTFEANRISESQTAVQFFDNSIVSKPSTTTTTERSDSVFKRPTQPEKENHINNVSSSNQDGWGNNDDQGWGSSEASSSIFMTEEETRQYDMTMQAKVEAMKNSSFEVYSLKENEIFFEDRSGSESSNRADEPQAVTKKVEIEVYTQQQEPIADAYKNHNQHEESNNFKSASIDNNNNDNNSGGNNDGWGGDDQGWGADDQGWGSASNIFMTEQEVTMNKMDEKVEELKKKAERKETRSSFPPITPVYGKKNRQFHNRNEHRDENRNEDHNTNDIDYNYNHGNSNNNYTNSNPTKHNDSFESILSRHTSERNRGFKRSRSRDNEDERFHHKRRRDSYERDVDYDDRYTGRSERGDSNDRFDRRRGSRGSWRDFDDHKHSVDDSRISQLEEQVALLTKALAAQTQLLQQLPHLQLAGILQQQQILGTSATPTQLQVPPTENSTIALSTDVKPTTELERNKSTEQPPEENQPTASSTRELEENNEDQWNVAEFQDLNRQTEEEDQTSLTQNVQQQENETQDAIVSAEQTVPQEQLPADESSNTAEHPETIPPCVEPAEEKVLEENQQTAVDNAPELNSSLNTEPEVQSTEEEKVPNEEQTIPIQPIQESKVQEPDQPVPAVQTIMEDEQEQAIVTANEEKQQDTQEEQTTNPEESEPPASVTLQENENKDDNQMMEIETFVQQDEIVETKFVIESSATTRSSEEEEVKPEENSVVAELEKILHMDDSHDEETDKPAMEDKFLELGLDLASSPTDQPSTTPIPTTTTTTTTTATATTDQDSGDLLSAILTNEKIE